MRIRSLCVGIDVTAGDTDLTTLHEQIDTLRTRVKFAIDLLIAAKEAFLRHGYEVQTLRIATSPLQQILKGNQHHLLPLVEAIQALVQSNGVIVAIGPFSDIDLLPQLPSILAAAPSVSASAVIPDDSKQAVQHAIAISQTVLELAQHLPDSSGNFRFAFAANCPPGIPYFPVAYHQGTQPALSIGLENSDLLVQAAQHSNHSIDTFISDFSNNLQHQCLKIQDIAFQFIADTPCKYIGIDTSLCPSLDTKHSIVRAFEELEIGQDRIDFGCAGTLFVCKLITAVLQGMDSSVLTCGYRGLMLPLAEDTGLASKQLTISQLLSYSSVCGTGIDTVPISGSVSASQLAMLLMDVHQLSHKLQLQKPLTCRVLPIVGKLAGQLTEFQSVYLTNCSILSL